jgi:hypothetical protein
MAVSMTLEVVTPKMAARWLAENNTLNRPMRSLWREYLARVITEGRWQVTHQGIAFNCDGTLLDGQHRLAAIVDAGKPVKMWVARGLPRPAMNGIDQGRNRTASDLAGPIGLEMHASRNHIAISRAMRDGFLTSRRNWGIIGNDEVLKYYARHHEAIAFAVDAFSGKKAKPHSCVSAPVARAWYTADRDRLREFGQVYITGVGNGPSDSGAVQLRILSLRDKDTFSGWGGRVALYAKTESALRAFLARRPIEKLMPVEAELYPIPE